MPLVSVIMPSFNHEEFISESIQSVLNQTLSDFELLIIDDASTDRSKKTIHSYAEKDRRIRTLFHEENKGIARTYNDGLDRAKGSYVATTASDDVWAENKLEKEIEVLQRNEDRVIWSEALVIDHQGNSTGKLFTQMKNASRRKKTGHILEELLKGNHINDITFKRENLKDIRFDEELKYLNDYKFYIDMAAKYEFYCIPEPLMMYRIHHGNTSESDKENWQKDILKLGDSVIRKYHNRISNKSKARIYLNMAHANSKLGNKAESKKCLVRAIKHYPFTWRNLKCFAACIRNKVAFMIGRSI